MILKSFSQTVGILKNHVSQTTASINRIKVIIDNKRFVAAFQRWINSVLGDLLGMTCSAHLDDIIIFTECDVDQHWRAVQQILERIFKAGLHLDSNNCVFASIEIKYSEFIISRNQGIKMDPEKIKAMSGWEALSNIREVRSFLGFSNFYQGSIKDFAPIAASLHNLTKKNEVCLDWTSSEFL